MNTPQKERVQLRTSSTSIWVTFDKVGFHRYPDAPDEVSYLRHLHRHVFKFKVRIDVHNDDREIEFHMFKRWLTSLYEGELKVDHKSCEMLAKELLIKIQENYDCYTRVVSVEVSEDGECGAIVTSAPMHGNYLLIEQKEVASASTGTPDCPCNCIGCETSGKTTDAFCTKPREKQEPGQEQR